MFFSSPASLSKKAKARRKKCKKRFVTSPNTPILKKSQKIVLIFTISTKTILSCVELFSLRLNHLLYLIETLNRDHHFLSFGYKVRYCPCCSCCDSICRGWCCFGLFVNGFHLFNSLCLHSNGIWSMSHLVQRTGYPFFQKWHLRLIRTMSPLYGLYWIVL